MRKVNIEKKVDMALNELVNCDRILDLNDPVFIDLAIYRIKRAISYLCMLDDYVVEEKSTYYCLSEIERNLTNYVEERKRRENENDNK